MNPIELEVFVGRPREEVFAYLSDIANHAEFTDHFLTDWHLTREQSAGRGAGARYRFGGLGRFGWADATLVDVEPPFRIVAAGRGGKFNRIRITTRWELRPSGGGTEVRLRTEHEPATLTDRLMEGLGRQRPRCRRSWGRALRRLRTILEDGEDRGVRVTVATG